MTQSKLLLTVPIRVFLDNYQSYDYLKSRAILAATIETVDNINDHVLERMSGNYSHVSL